MPPRARRRQRARPLPGDRSRARGELWAPASSSVVAARAEHGRRVAAERLGRSLSDRVERRLCGQRLAQHGRDPVEAALDLRLARALLVRLGVAEGDRREAREGLDQPEVRLVEAAGSREQTPRTPRGLAEREDRRVHHLFEDRVVRRRGGCSVPGSSGEDRPAGGDRLADRAGGRDPAADLRVGQPDARRGTRSSYPPGQQRPAVGSVAVHERAHLVDEPVDHDVDAEVARQGLARLEQRLLLGEPAVALAEQPARVDRDRSLLRRRPRRARSRGSSRRRGAVQGEHADQPLRETIGAASTA